MSTRQHGHERKLREDRGVELMALIAEDQAPPRVNRRNNFGESDSDDEESAPLVAVTASFGTNKAAAVQTERNRAWARFKGRFDFTWGPLQKSRCQMAAFGATGLLLVLLIWAWMSYGGTKGSGSGPQAEAQGPQRRYDGDPTVSPTCSASLPRTYCGRVEIGKGDCEATGCCWWPQPAEGRNKDTPSCFWPNTAPGQYKVVSKVITGLGYQLELELSQPVLPALGPDFPRLTVLIEGHTDQRVHVKIAPVIEQGEHPRWEIPEDLLPRPVPPADPPGSPEFLVLLPEVGEDFWVQVCRNTGLPQSNASCVFDTRNGGLVFKEQYMQLTTALEPGSGLYGLGETVLPSGLQLPRNGKLITMWNADTAAAGPTSINLYGSHPFFLEVRPTGTLRATSSAHGVVLLNSNGMDVELWPEHLTYRVIGGVLDFHVMVGPEPESVIQQYQEVIGRPALPPRWSLGWHQCKWGYRTVLTLKAVVKNYQMAGIPLDVIWSDIDFMDQYRVFTFDNINYPIEEMASFVKGLALQAMHWVPIQDPAVQASAEYPVYSEGVEKGVFVRTAGSPNPYMGQVWAGYSVWPDFLNPDTRDYWQSHIGAFLDTVPASGLWLDMNEASNFCTGNCTSPGIVVYLWRRLTRSWTSCRLDCTLPKPVLGASRDTNFPPYAINNLGHYAALNTHTLAMNAHHSGHQTEYDTHNLYSLSEAKVTYEALQQLGHQRPFLLSRSSFLGMGRYAAHWTGDNAATWIDLKWSIQGILNSNMWGIPLVGADICGFIGNSNEELCARWIEAGAFYPFARNHAEKSSSNQEAYVWPLTTLAGQTALRLRYRLLPYLYTTFYSASTRGGTVARPLFFESPFTNTDQEREASDTQWLLGSSLMVAPVLEPNALSRPVFFPPGSWHRLAPNGSVTESVTGPVLSEVAAPIGKPSVWAKAGSVIPLSSQIGRTTAQAARAPLVLLLLMNDSCQGSTNKMVAAASGMMYSDDGVTFQPSLNNINISTPTPVTSLAVTLSASCQCADSSQPCSGQLTVLPWRLLSGNADTEGGISAPAPPATAATPAINGTWHGGGTPWQASGVLVSELRVVYLGRRSSASGGSRNPEEVTAELEVAPASQQVALGLLVVGQEEETGVCQEVEDQTSVTGMLTGDGSIFLSFVPAVPLGCLQRVVWKIE